MLKNALKILGTLAAVSAYGAFVLWPRPRQGSTGTANSGPVALKSKKRWQDRLADQFVHAMGA